MGMRGRGRGIKLVVDLFADEVDSEGDKGDAEAGSGVAELVPQHRVLPPFVPPPEELSRRTQWFRHLSLSLFSLSSSIRCLGQWKGNADEKWGSFIGL